MRKKLTFTAVIACTSILVPSCFGQASDNAPPPSPPAAAVSAEPANPATPVPRFGVALSAGTSGAGIEFATGIARHTNFRAGFNYFTWTLSGTDSSNGLSYSGTLRLASGEVLVDQNVAGPFHISGGALLYNGFRGTGSVHVPGGQTLTLNNVTYVSSASDPVTGTGAVTVRKVAPEVLFGLGNLLPRSQRHFTVNLDIGAAFQGSPNVALNLTGSTCLAQTCTTIGSNSSVQANIAAEQSKISNTLKPFQFYPVIRLTFGYKR
jgi:hypothetical protein